LKKKDNAKLDARNRTIPNEHQQTPSNQYKNKLKGKLTTRLNQGIQHYAEGL
jgi:hypothetical protein